jgi:hypothetical protein
MRPRCGLGTSENRLCCTRRAAADIERERILGHTPSSKQALVLVQPAASHPARRQFDIWSDSIRRPP